MSGIPVPPRWRVSAGGPSRVGRPAATAEMSRLLLVVIVFLFV
jgi:hypothetical protein